MMTTSNNTARRVSLAAARYIILAVLLTLPSLAMALPNGGYPYANMPRCADNQCTPDPWNFFYRECTSFVAWKVNELNPNLNFHNWYGGIRWSHATNWDVVARKVGFEVNSTPAVNAIAQWKAGRGHVAIVTAVDGDQITIEEYNFDRQGNFNTRPIQASAPDNYIHMVD